ncbi:Secondary metabolism regulator LAE1 [Colletotrichum sp. SAR 10_96]|nr:Secondary metabolism regulator LAE1 [Colletotrichum sp. SAR 10_96]
MDDSTRQSGNAVGTTVAAVDPPPAVDEDAEIEPEDEGFGPELNRLDLAHILMFKSIGYRLLPSNVKFIVDDVESAWIDPKKYDYIFVRYMLVSIADWPRLISNIYELADPPHPAPQSQILIVTSHLTPGGYAEFQDMDGLYYADDATYPPSSSLSRWNARFVDACEAMGRTARPGPALEGWVRAHGGFRGATHKRFKAPIGPWARDPPFKDVGALNLRQLLEGLEGFSLKVFCGVLGWEEGDVRELLERVRAELGEGLMHVIFDQ